MARDFSAGTDEIDCGADSSIADIFDSGGTFFCWFIVDVHTVNMRWFEKAKVKCYLQNVINPTFRVSFEYEFDTNNGTWRIPAPSNSFTEGNLYSTGFTYDNGSASNDPIGFINGEIRSVQRDIAPVGTRVSDASDNLFIGNRADAARNFHGMLSYFTYWSGELVENDFAIMDKGVNPFAIRNSDIKFLAPLNGNDSSTADYSGNGNIGTITGTTKSSTHPPVELLENYLSEA